MTDMYDEKKVPDFTLPPYPHEEHGSEVRLDDSYFFALPPLDSIGYARDIIGDFIIILIFFGGAVVPPPPPARALAWAADFRNFPRRCGLSSDSGI